MDPTTGSLDVLNSSRLNYPDFSLILYLHLCPSVQADSIIPSLLDGCERPSEICCWLQTSIILHGLSSESEVYDVLTEGTGKGRRRVNRERDRHLIGSLARSLPSYQILATHQIFCRYALLHIMA